MTSFDPEFYNRTLNMEAVAMGKVPGASIMAAMGEREGIGTTAQGEDIWRGNDLTPAPTSTTTIPTPADAGEQMTVVSEHATDTIAGVGVQKIKLHYLDATGAEQTEEIEMNGTTGVDTVAIDMRFINDMYTVQVGSNGVSVGHIKIYKKGSVGLVYSMIEAGGNRALVPHRMVPIGKKLLIKEWHSTEAQAKRVAYRLRSTDMNGVLLPGIFCFKDASYLKQAASGDYRNNILIPALSIVKVSGWAVVLGGEGSCGWWGILFND